MKYLGIDYGEKRIGIAVSDPEAKIAFPLKTVSAGSEKNAIQELAVLIRKEKINKIIMGLPRAADGNDTPISLKVRAFAHKLHEELMLPVEFENELLTSRLAEQAGVKKQNIDQASAALILQSYLDKQQKK